MPRGRPKGSKNKPKTEAPKKRERPKGSKNKPKVEEPKKKRGRPKGSKNKPKVEAPEVKLEEPKAEVAAPKKKRGRPKGSKNKPKDLPLIETPEPKLTKFQEEIQKFKEERKTKANKRRTAPGPWSDIDPGFIVKAELKLNKGIIGECYGTYPKHSPVVCAKGWYPILFNLTSKHIKRDVAKHGLDNYVAACEKSLNRAMNKEKYGTVVIMKVATDNSQNEDPERRFLSCYAKTNKYSISGFAAIRNRLYQVIE